MALAAAISVKPWTARTRGVKALFRCSRSCQEEPPPAQSPDESAQEQPGDQPGDHPGTRRQPRPEARRVRAHPEADRSGAELDRTRHLLGDVERALLVQILADP